MATYNPWEATVSWNGVEIVFARDITFNDQASKIDYTSRNDVGYKNQKAGLIEASLTFDMVVDDSTPILENMQTDFHARTQRTVVYTNSKGTTYTFTGSIINFTEQSPLDGANVLNVEIASSGQITIA